MRGKWIVDDFQRALVKLEDALEQDTSGELAKAGCIQYFEFTFELAWKAAKLALRLEGIEANSPRAVLRECYAQGWIGDEATWLAMLGARNQMSHTYDAATALEVFDSLGSFVPPLCDLLRLLRERPRG
jgi:nucleotidyltransferase substrate binding protein (TIGR01987 family)